MTTRNTPDLIEMMNTAETSPRRYVLTSNFHLPSLLARGVLFADAIENRVSNLDDSPEAVELSVFENRPLASDLERISKSARNAFPIALRLEISGTPRKLAVSPNADTVECVLLDDVSAIVFASEREANLFNSWKFSNYRPDTAVMGIEVSPELFVASEATSSDDALGAKANLEAATGLDAAPVATPKDQPEVAAQAVADHVAAEQMASAEKDGASEGVNTSLDFTQLLRKGESAAALLSAYLCRVPATADWLGDWGDAFKDDPKSPLNPGVGRLRTMLVATLAPERLEFDDSDSILLVSAVRVLERYPLSAGWPSKEVLERIVEGALEYCRARGLERVERDVRNFEERARAVLNDEIANIDLSDDPARLNKRSIVLMLLRGDIAAIENSALASEGGKLGLGPNVKALALCLAAIRYGLHALPSELKGTDDAVNTKILLRALAEYLLEAMMFVGGASEAVSPVPDLAVQHKTVSEFDTEWTYEAPAGEIRRRRSERDPALSRLIALSQDLGFAPKKFGDKGLEHVVPIKDSSPKVVRVELLNSSWGGTQVVRFWSQAVAVGRGQKLSDEHARHVNKGALSKKLYSDLLKLNIRSDRHARVALSEDETDILVVVDQLLSTLDDDEYRFNVDCVAREAIEVAQHF